MELQGCDGSGSGHKAGTGQQRSQVCHRRVHQKSNKMGNKSVSLLSGPGPAPENTEVDQGLQIRLQSQECPTGDGAAAPLAPACADTCSQVGEQRPHHLAWTYRSAHGVGAPCHAVFAEAVA
jgi:hypothetical protein